MIEIDGIWISNRLVFCISNARTHVVDSRVHNCRLYPMFTARSFLIKTVCLNCHRLVARKRAINIRAGDEKAPTEKKSGRKQKLNARVQKIAGKYVRGGVGVRRKRIKKERRRPGLFNSRRRPYKLLGCFTQLFVRTEIKRRSKGIRPRSVHASFYFFKSNILNNLYRAGVFRVCIFWVIKMWGVIISSDANMSSIQFHHVCLWIFF